MSDDEGCGDWLCACGEVNTAEYIVCQGCLRGRPEPQPDGGNSTIAPFSVEPAEPYLTRTQNAACALVFKAYCSKRITKDAALAAYPEIARQSDEYAETVINDFRRMLGEDPTTADQRAATLDALRAFSERLVRGAP